jgi:hypothetical protein
MRTTFLVAPLFVLTASTAAFAQSAVILNPPAADDVIVEDSTVGAVPVDPTIHETLRPGSIIPVDIPLKLFTADAAPNLRGFAYFVSVDYKMVVVDPATRTVVHIMDMPG